MNRQLEKPFNAVCKPIIVSSKMTLLEKWFQDCDIGHCFSLGALVTQGLNAFDKSVK